MSIKDKNIRDMTFGVMIAGMMQRQAPLNGYDRVFQECMEVKDGGLFGTCVRSATTGMMEHGEPGQEYVKPLAECGQPFLQKRGGTELCYRALGLRLSRFYEPDKKETICNMFPAAYVRECLSST